MSESSNLYKSIGKIFGFILGCWWSVGMNFLPFSEIREQITNGSDFSYLFGFLMLAITVVLYFFVVDFVNSICELGEYIHTKTETKPHGNEYLLNILKSLNSEKSKKQQIEDEKAKILAELQKN